jgi:hypothetical protein
MLCHASGSREGAPAPVADVVICCYLIRKFLRLSRKERPGGSLPAFAQGDVARELNLCLPGYRAHSLSPPSHTRTANGASCDLPAATEGSNTGLPCSAGITRWVKPCLFTGDHCVRVLPEKQKSSRPLTFWFRPDSIFSLFYLTMFISSSHMLAIPSSLAPHPHDACRCCLTSRPQHGPQTRLRYPGSFTPEHYCSRMCR